MFCGATVYSANNIELSETKDIATQLKTFNVQQKSLWESRLIDIMKANSNTLHVIIIHLLDTVKQGHKQYLSRYINIKLYKIQLKITLYWLKELTEGEYSRISNVSRKSSSQQLQILAQNSNNISNNMNNNQNKRIYSNIIVNFIQTMLANIRNDCNNSNNNSDNSDIVQLTEVLIAIIAVVEQFYSIVSIENISHTGSTTNTAGATTSITATTTGAGTSSSSSLGKRKQEVAVVKTKDNATTTTTATTNATTKNANNIIRKSVDFPVWPLGCLPGQLSTGALFLVEDTE